MRSSNIRKNGRVNTMSVTRRTKNSDTKCKFQLLIVVLVIVSVSSLSFLMFTNSSISLSVKDKIKKFGGSLKVMEERGISNLRPYITTVNTTMLATRSTTATAAASTAVVPTVDKTIINREPPKVLFPNSIHFIHIPKCGGTTMTIILRQMQCARNPVENTDCCTNPGFCDWHAKRRCKSIDGCTNHFPNRILSAWFYRGHSPNLDFFSVRPWFKEISEGKRPRVTFEEYMDMHEYMNIQTRMLGADSFPYRNITVNEEVYRSAIEAMDNIFFVGLQEEFEISAKLILLEMGVVMNFTFVKERDQSNSQIAQEKATIKGNNVVMKKLRLLNHFDLDLYAYGVKKFCNTLKKYPHLFEEVQRNNKVQCM